MICVVTGAGGDTGPAIVDILSRECKSVVAVVRGNVDSWKESVGYYLTASDFSKWTSPEAIAQTVVEIINSE